MVVVVKVVMVLEVMIRPAAEPLGALSIVGHRCPPPRPPRPCNFLPPVDIVEADVFGLEKLR